MGAPQFEQAGADISGTGTTNTIPRWTGPSTLGDSAITDDGSVIRASRQTWILNVNGLRVSDGGTTNFARISQSGANSIIDGLAPSGQVWIRTNAGATLAIAATNTGNVGIGTASPSARLEIASTTAATAQFRLSNASGLTNWWEIGRDNATTGALIFASNIGEQMRITPAGNLGIGTASPASRLDVAGTITCDDAGTGLKLPATPGNADTQTLDCYAEVAWTPADVSGAGLTITVNRATYTKIGRTVTASFDITYPVTANGTAAQISLPESTGTANLGTLSAPYCSVALAAGLTGIVTNGKIVFYYGYPSANVPNSTFSGARIVASVTFTV